MIESLLGGISPAHFLERYWQKQALLVRQAIPGFTGVVSRERIFELAGDPDVESRLVRCEEGRWSLQHGPLPRRALRGRKPPWTVLIQGLNLFEPAADALLRQFHFIPQARLDDLMVSYAVDGGGVGPHVDRYDVFLLQGSGKRRWQVAQDCPPTLLADAPLRILQHFEPAQDWVLEPGDMLYLPPRWAHHGVAIGECTTYSIGFRSPGAQELAGEFLAWLQERVCLDDLYADPDLTLQENAALIGEQMIARVSDMLAKITWSREDVAAFLGQSLTEPKPHVFFEPPETPMSPARLRAAIARTGFHLDRRSLLLFTEHGFYLNGDTVDIAPDDAPALRDLAHRRNLAPGCALTTTLVATLHEWYCAGFGHPGQ